MLRFRSVVSRIIALHLLAIIVTSICIPLALYMMLNYAARNCTIAHCGTKQPRSCAISTAGQTGRRGCRCRQP